MKLVYLYAATCRRVVDQVVRVAVDYRVAARGRPRHLSAPVAPLPRARGALGRPPRPPGRGCRARPGRGEPARPHLRYLGYVVRHKWFVLLAGLKVRAPLWRLLIHDWSKLSPAEWRPYVQKFYGRGENQDEFDAAWLHHQHRNPHHWQHWLLREDDGPTKALRMPQGLVREMVADWMGAGRAITGEWDVAGWYAKNAEKMVLHPEVREQVESLIRRAPSAYGQPEEER